MKCCNVYDYICNIRSAKQVREPVVPHFSAKWKLSGNKVSKLRGY